MLTMSQDFPKHMGCSCFDEAHSLVNGYPCNQVTRYLKMHVHIKEGSTQSACENQGTFKKSLDM